MLCLKGWLRVFQKENQGKDVISLLNNHSPSSFPPWKKGWGHQILTFPYFLGAKSGHVIQFWPMRCKIKSAGLGRVSGASEKDRWRNAQGEAPSFPFFFGVCYVSSQSGAEAAVLWPWGYKPEGGNTCWGCGTNWGKSKPPTYSFFVKNEMRLLLIHCWWGIQLLAHTGSLTDSV